MLFEVISYEGDGRIRYNVLYEINPELCKQPGCSSRWERGNGYPSIAGEMIHQRGVRHNDEMTFPELIAHIEGMVQTRREKYA